MFTDFHPIPSAKLAAATAIHLPQQRLPERVSLNDPAIDVMTDLSRVAAVTIDALETLETAGRRMLRRGVRLLIVEDEHGYVNGLLTSTDLLGEKPMQFAQRSGMTRRDLLVQHIMTPHAEIEMLHLKDVLHAKVGNVVATLKKTGRRHALVVDGAAAEEQKVRGIFSASQIGKQLGIEIETAAYAQTFAEIEAQLAR